MATKLVAIDPDGGQHFRRTDRDYSHAVLIYSKPWLQDTAHLQGEIDRFESWNDSNVKTEYLARYKQYLAEATDTYTWGVLSFCGRYDLAVKARDKAIRRGNIEGGRRVEIVPVAVAPTKPRKVRS